MHDSKRRKVLVSLLTVGVLGAVAAFGIFGAFSSSVSNDGNEFTSASLDLSDNSHTQPVYFKTNAVPGDTGDNGSECIVISYDGGAAAQLKLYGSTTGATGLQSDVNLEITSGAGDEQDCSDFVASDEAGDVYEGTLAAFQSGHTNWANGIGLGTVNDEDATTYMFHAELDSGADPETAQGKSAGDQTFTWEVQAGS